MNDISVYECKDGRTRVYVKETGRVMSYPKYLIEQEIGRELTPGEEIHHKDHDPLNNDLSNLEIRKHGEHQREHSVKYHDVVAICGWCGKEFLWDAVKQRRFYNNRSRFDKTYLNDKPFCSKSCCGAFTASIQYDHARVVK